MTGFFRFPRTPHLAWLGAGRARDDKVLSPEEAARLLSRPVVVEEKLDGANIGISADGEGTVRVQNRGSYLEWDALHPQFKPLRQWLDVRRARLARALGSDRILFGEWCYARHSIPYTQLPDWFIAFDVYDRASGEFWSTTRRDVFVRDLDLTVVPRIAEGRFSLEGIKALLGPSTFTGGPAEGVYVRVDGAEHLQDRAKLVRSEFTQLIAEHWSRSSLVPNSLAAASPGPDGPHQPEQR